LAREHLLADRRQTLNFARAQRLDAVWTVAAQRDDSGTAIGDEVRRSAEHPRRDPARHKQSVHRNRRRERSNDQPTAQRRNGTRYQSAPARTVRLLPTSASLSRARPIRSSARKRSPLRGRAGDTSVLDTLDDVFGK
jgi:hypothetical protein